MSGLEKWSRSEDVVEPKFLCPTHSEAEQTEKSEFGAEQSLLQKTCKVSFSRQNLGGEGCRVCDLLLIG